MGPARRSGLGHPGRRTDLRARGSRTVLVETGGVGQNEVDVSWLAATTLVVVAPGMGDGVQAGKAGLLERGDVYVISKADRPDPLRLRRELRTSVALGHRDSVPPVLTTVATTGEGVEELLHELDRRAAHVSGLTVSFEDFAPESKVLPSLGSAERLTSG